MFEYAAARALATILNLRLKLHIDSLNRTPEAVTPRSYELGVFKNVGLVTDELTDAETKMCDAYLQNPAYKIYNRLRKVCRLTPAFTYHTDGYSLVQTPYLPELKGEIIYLAGLWQNEGWFAPVTNLIRHEFTFPPIADDANAALSRQIQSTNAVSLHVRRGDYLTEPNFASVAHVCSIEYYERAVAYIASRVPIPVFYIFSDELDWVKQHLVIPYPCVYVDANEGGKNYEDMRLMSLCRHHIIANSTFSWWGAWLNAKPDKIVIAPEKWLPKSNGAAARHVIPPNWISM